MGATYFRDGHEFYSRAKWRIILAHGVVQLARVLGCRHVLLEVVSGGALRFVGPCPPELRQPLDATESAQSGRSPARHIPDPQLDDASLSRRPENLHSVDPSNLSPRLPKWSFKTLTLKLSLTASTRHLESAVNSLVAKDGFRLAHLAIDHETGEKVIVKFEPPNFVEAA